MSCQSRTRSLLPYSIGVLLAGAVAAVGIEVTPAHAFSLVSSEASFNLTFNDPNFADASVSYLQVGRLQSSPGDAANLSVTILPSAQDYGFAGADMSFALLSQNNNVYTYGLSSQGVPSAYQYGYTIPIATEPGARFFENGTWRLAFGFNPIATLFSSSTTLFNYSVLISGNWSTFGIEPGQVEFSGVGSNYSVNSNFVYNPQTNQTLLRVGSDNWDGTSAEIGFILTGPRETAAVPEPATLLGIALGGAGLAKLRSRRQKQTSDR